MTTIFYIIRLLIFIAIVLILVPLSLLILLTIVAFVVKLLSFIWKPLLLIVLVGLPSLFLIGLVVAFLMAAFKNDAEVIKSYLTGCKNLTVKGANKIYEIVVEDYLIDSIKSFREGWAWVQVGSKQRRSDE